LALEMLLPSPLPSLPAICVEWEMLLADGEVFESAHTCSACRAARPVVLDCRVGVVRLDDVVAAVPSRLARRAVMSRLSRLLHQDRVGEGMRWES